MRDGSAQPGRFNRTGWIALAAAVMFPAAALAQDAGASSDAGAPNYPPCSGLNPVYFAGTLTGNVMLQQAAIRLAMTPGNPTVVFQPLDSCAADADVVFTGTCAAGTAQCLSGTGTYYTPDPNGSNIIDTNYCALPAAGVPVDVALSDFSTKTCNVFFQTGVDADYDGPVQGIEFVQPIDGIICGQNMGGCSEFLAVGQPASTVCCPLCNNCLGSAGCVLPPPPPRGITEEQAYFMLGFPQGGGAEPWTDPTQVFLPGPESVEQFLLQKFIGIPADAMLGVDESANGGDTGVVAGLAIADTEYVGDAIGLVTTNTYDADRRSTSPKLSAVAYQAPGQRRAYFPDSVSLPGTSGGVPATFDKKSLRDGHYLLWGYLHALVRQQSPNAGTANLFGTFLAGHTPVGSDNYTVDQGAVDSNLIPQCAMSVQRANDGTDLTAYTPPNPCNCFFDSAFGSTTSGCARCSTNNPCATGGCNDGFCE